MGFQSAANGQYCSAFGCNSVAFGSYITSIGNAAGTDQNLATPLNNTFIGANTSDHFTDDDEFLLMTEKGVYPYDYIDSYNRLYEDKLPIQSDFYSMLSSLECSDKDYERAQLVWNTFKYKNFLDYHNIYLISDVLLLADILNNFRIVCFKIYRLDCCYYYTAPSLSWDSMLKITKIEL